MRFTKHQLALQILTLFEAEKRGLNRFNVIGRPFQEGSIELTLGTKFTDDERAFAGEILKDLESRGMVIPTYGDIISPGDWLIISDKGKNVFSTKALDELDELLRNLNSTSDLISMRYGAYDALIYKNTDWPRHAATSCRELITKVLHTVSPDTDVLNDPGFKPVKSSKNGITRAERVKHYLRGKSATASSQDINVIDKACDLVDAAYDKLSSVTHTDAKEVENLIKLTEEALKFMLKD